MPLRKASSKNNNRRTTNKEQDDYIFVSYSSSSIVTPDKDIRQELVIKNNSGKITGSYREAQNGKQVVNKEFKSEKGNICKWCNRIYS